MAQYGSGSVSETALQHHELYAVIMAGGQGTRFWPRSRRKMPKQLLNIVGETTMLEQTVARISPLIPAERTLVVAGQTYRDPIRACLPQLPAENFLFEPVGRNTAACVAWAALWVRQRASDAVMAVLPADHLIRHEAEFLRVLQVAALVAQPLNRLVTIGIQPSHPETGYGYIRASANQLQVDGRPVFRVAQFVEKPSRHKAEQFLAAGTYVWNSGMFVWRADSIWLEILPPPAPARTHPGAGDRHHRCRCPGRCAERRVSAAALSLYRRGDHGTGSRCLGGSRRHRLERCGKLAGPQRSPGGGCAGQCGDRRAARH